MIYLNKFVKQLKAFKNSNPISIRNCHNVELKQVLINSWILIQSSTFVLRLINIIWSFFFLIVWFKRWPNCHFEDWNISRHEWSWNFNHENLFSGEKISWEIFFLTPFFPIGVPSNSTWPKLEFVKEWVVKSPKNPFKFADISPRILMVCN